MIKLIKNSKINIKYNKNKNIFLVFLSNKIIFTYKVKNLYILNLGILSTNYILLLRILRQFGLIKNMVNKLDY